MFCIVRLTELIPAQHRYKTIFRRRGSVISRHKSNIAMLTKLQKNLRTDKFPPFL